MSEPTIEQLAETDRLTAELAAGPLWLTCARCGKREMKYHMQWRMDDDATVHGPFCCGLNDRGHG